jgi:predicted LPLAT superfamily acyltransferase
MVLFFFLFKVLPPFFLSLAAYPVGFCYFLFFRKGRDESRRFLRRFAAFRPDRGGLSALKHITAFALTLVEKVLAWGGGIPFKRIHFQNDGVNALIGDLEQGRGAALLCSHLGNAELLRALADFRRTGVSRPVPVTSVIDFDVIPRFSGLLARLNPRSSLKIISANAIDPGSIIALQEETERGGLAVIAGDRTSAHNRDKVFMFPFLGKPAPFPQGPFVLASLLDVPVYAVFALRRGDLSPIPDYDMYVHPLAPPTAGPEDGAAEVGGSRKKKREIAESRARRFAALLEGYCLQHPYQWYNFFDFWTSAPSREAEE